MRVRSNLKKLIRKESNPMLVMRITAVLDEDTGLFNDTSTTTDNLFGCFQPILRFDDEFSNYMLQLPEGERQEASVILWTEFEVRPGPTTFAANDQKEKADLVYDCLTKTWYKVVYVRNKIHGGFFRAYLGEINAPEQ